LEETLQVVKLQQMDNDNPSSNKMFINESHRKSMMRALLGMNKVQFDQELRDIHTQQQWSKAKHFVDTYLLDMLSQLSAPTLEEAPEFEQTLQEYYSSQTTRFQQKPALLFSNLARGRTYQGKFERLLRDKRPDLLDLFMKIFEELSKVDLLRMFVEQYTDCRMNKNTTNTNPQNDADGDNDNPQRTSQQQLTEELLLQCVDYEFQSLATPQPADGGSSGGKKCESNLLSYLLMENSNTNHNTNHNHTQDDDDDGLQEEQITTQQVLAPVWIRNKGSNKAFICSKRCAYAIELPSTVNLHGMTSELDAVVVAINKRKRRILKQTTDNDNNDTHTTKEEEELLEIIINNQDDVDEDQDEEEATATQATATVQLLQIWEAKATLNPSTLRDVLSKKYRTVTTMMEHIHNNHNNDATTTLVIQGNERFQVIQSPASSSSQSSPPFPHHPQLGIFANNLLSPQAAARRARLVIGEQLLETDAQVVQQALQVGFVEVPPQLVEQSIRHLLQLAHKIQPILIIAG
jgi:hypothetical protein